MGIHGAILRMVRFFPQETMIQKSDSLFTILDLKAWMEKVYKFLMPFFPLTWLNCALFIQAGFEDNLECIGCVSDTANTREKENGYRWINVTYLEITPRKF